MPSGVEIRTQQKRTLYAVKKLQYDIKDAELQDVLKAVKELVKAFEAEMEQEDIAFIEKKIAE